MELHYCKYGTITVMQKLAKHESLPVHVIPSPMYPLLQAHTKDPGVFVHVASGSQGDMSHSFISERVHLGRWNCIIASMAQLQ